MIMNGGAYTGVAIKDKECNIIHINHYRKKFYFVTKEKKEYYVEYTKEKGFLITEDMDKQKNILVKNYIYKTLTERAKEFNYNYNGKLTVIEGTDYYFIGNEENKKTEKYSRTQYIYKGEKMIFSLEKYYNIWLYLNIKK